MLVTTQSNAKTCDVEDLKSIVSGFTLKHLTPKVENEKVSLKYSGFFYKESARLEGRKVLTKATRCKNVEYNSQTTLFSYKLDIELK